MKVLVTGASGFIGSALVDHLASKGHTVTCLIRDDKKRTKFNHNTEFIVADITDRDKLLQSMSNIDVDALFHLAAINPLEKDKKVQKRVNIDGMKNVIDACMKSNVKLFIYAQGTGVYGNTNGEWIDESTPKNPDTDLQKLDMKRKRCYGRQTRRMDYRSVLQYWETFMGILAGLQI